MSDLTENLGYEIARPSNSIMRLHPHGIALCKEALVRITELEAQLSKSQWVSVDKELPEDCKPVIIRGGCGHYSHSNGKWYTNMERLNNGDYRQISWIVTEWQHLPEPSQ